MTDDKKPKVIEGEVLPPETERAVNSGGWFSSLGKAAEKKAVARAIRAENEAAEEAVRNQDLRAQYEVGKRNVAVEIDKNKNIQMYTDVARGEVRLDLQKQDAEMADLRRQEEEARAAGERAVQGYAADRAEESKREAEAEAGRLRAEAEALDAEINIELKRKKLERLRHDRAGTLAKAEAELRAENVNEAELEEQLEDLQNPVLDDDPSQPMRLKQVTKKLADTREKIRALEQHIEDLR